MGRLRVRVQPGAKRSELTGRQEGVWRLRLAARPVEGRANEALLGLLAELLSLPKSRLAIAAGHTGRDKLVDVDGLAAEEIENRLSARLQ